MNTITTLKVSTPGRVCLFGEHQDYLGLPIIAAAISLRIFVEGEHTSDSTITIEQPDIQKTESFKIDEPITYEVERDYYKSVINVLKRHGLTFSNGVHCHVHGNIPINAGTSSSSALIVAWVNFMAQMSDQEQQLDPETIALYAYEAEVLEFSEPGGMMDQYSTSVGNIIYLESVPKVRVESIKAKLGSFVLGNSCEPKDTIHILRRVKNQIQQVVKNLQLVHPEFSLQTAQYDEIDRYANEITQEQLELLKGTVLNRDILRKAKSLLSESVLNHKALGELLSEHHEILKEPLKISTPKIDRMIAAALKAGAYGAKINGSGGGGCMFAYAPENAEEVKAAIEAEGGEAYIIEVDEGTIGNRVE